jgi:hypothetical protein
MSVIYLQELAANPTRSFLEKMGGDGVSIFAWVLVLFRG